MIAASVLDTGWTLVAFLPLAGFAFVLRRLWDSWLAPGRSSLAYWAIMCGAVVLLAPDFPVRWYVPLMLLGYAFVVATGSEIGSRMVRPDSLSSIGHGARPRIVELVRAAPVLGVCTTIGFASIPAVLASRGWRVTDMVDPTSYLALARDFAGARYHEAFDPPMIDRLSTVAVFAGAGIGGLAFASTRSTRLRILSIGPVVASLFQDMVTTTRTKTLIALCLFVGGYLATKVMEHRRAGGFRGEWPWRWSW